MLFSVDGMFISGLDSIAIAEVKHLFLKFAMTDLGHWQKLLELRQPFP